MDPKTTLLAWIIVWLLACGVIMWYSWRYRTVGVVAAYLLQFWLLHWVAAVAYLWEWSGKRSEQIVVSGFSESGIGVIALTLGVLVTPTLTRRSSSREVQWTVSGASAGRRLTRYYVWVGLGCYFVLAPILGPLPTITAIIASGLKLALVGLALRTWLAWKQKDRRGFWQAVVWVALLPFLTILTQGFLGYGTTAAMSCFAFVAAYYKPRWRMFLVGLLIAFCGLSFFVTYLRDRGEIRKEVWGGSGLSARMESLGNSLADFEFFDPTDVEHLKRIDGRLNQNYIVGAAVSHLGAERARFAYGGTLWDAVLALVPRALWRDKPIVVGGSGTVTKYTGIRYLGGTSIGMGQVFELYVNFGSLGVFFGMFLFGGTLAYVDQRAALGLHRGNWESFGVWYVLGLSILEAEGSFVEITAAMAGSFILARVTNAIAKRRSGGGPQPQAAPTPRDPPLGARAGPPSDS